MEEIKKIFKYLETVEERLNPSQIRFIQSLRKHYRKNRSLSEKQLFILREIRNFIAEMNADEA